MSPTARIAPPALIGLAAVLLVACRPELVVRLSTVVYHDGSLTRVLEATGRTADGEVPTEDRWLSERAGVDLADPDAWDRVDREAGSVRAEGFFLKAEDLPPLLSLRTAGLPTTLGSGLAQRQGKVRTQLDVDDRVLLRRWVFSESHGDPFAAVDKARALEALVDLALEALETEVRRQFGDELDTSRAESFLREDVRSLGAALLAAGQVDPGWERTTRRTEKWQQILERAGLLVVPSDDPFTFWENQLPALLEWGRRGVADALATAASPIAPADLTFWPAADNYDEGFAAISEHVWGGEDELSALAEPHVAALMGYYGGDDMPRFRFEARVQMPGTLLRTNGTPDDDSVVWIFREQELNHGEVVLRVETVEPQADPLTSLGAPRHFDRASLVRLADLLWKQDPEGALVEVLRAAVGQGSLEPLRDEDAVPLELQPTALELAELLEQSDERG